MNVKKVKIILRSVYDPTEKGFSETTIECSLSEYLFLKNLSGLLDESNGPSRMIVTRGG